jgi:protein SCO1
MMQSESMNRSIGAGAPVIGNSFSRRAQAAVQAGVLFFSLAGTSMAHTSSTPTLGSYNNIGIEPHLGAQVPLNLKFQDESGQTVTMGSYFDKKPVILSLVYYGCRMMCTLTEYGMVNALKQIPGSIGDQYDILTVSFDPREKSDVAMLNKKTYVGLYGRPSAPQGWHFLVGDVPSIHALTDAVGFHYEYMAEIDLFSHPTGIMILTPTGKVSSYFYGIEYRAQELEAAIIDASNEKIATPGQINARMHNGVAGGANPSSADSATKPQCPAPAMNHPVAPAVTVPAANQ